MEMMKEGTVSGSPRNTDSGSPAQPVTTQLPQVMNLNVGNTGGPTPPPQQPLATATMTTTTATAAAAGGTGQGSLDLFGKKKRGRPRKYDSEGNLRVVTSHSHQQGAAAAAGPPGFSLTPGSAPEFSSKRGRGRPHGSGNWNLLASLGMFAGATGSDFTPHVVTVYAGEDVAGKIFSFAQKGPIGICILSANGAISKVTLRQPGSSGGILTYEGRFEILSLSGSFTVIESGSIVPNGGLSVSLAGPDGRVIGGGVAGLLTAAGPIQIVIGSFMPNGHKSHKRKQHREHTAAYRASGAPRAPETVAGAGPISQSNPGSENILRPAPQLPEQGQRESVSATSDKLNLDDTLNAADWNGSEDFSDHRPSPDINISLRDD